MTPFTRLHAVAVPLPEANIDTDQILPARFLSRPRAAGLGDCLFANRRAAGGRFGLDDPAYDGRAILVTGANFGCGSSREAAVYALLDGGIRCVIAPSFGDIFRQNALLNGLLPVEVPQAVATILLNRAEREPGLRLTVDLAEGWVAMPEGHCATFVIDSYRRRLLIKGRDELDDTLKRLPVIENWESLRL